MTPAAAHTALQLSHLSRMTLPDINITPLESPAKNVLSIVNSYGKKRFFKKKKTLFMCIRSSIIYLELCGGFDDDDE